MVGPIHTEVHVAEPGGCPVATASRGVDGQVDEVARTMAASADGAVEELATPGPVARAYAPAEPLVETAERAVYRYPLDDVAPCVCAVVERHGAPVSDIRARDGALSVTFTAADLDAVRAVVADLRDAFDGVRVERLARPAGGDEGDPVLVDRGALTGRQREVLRTALSMGYFAYPRDANAGEVAAALDISPSTFSEHLAAAQRKVMDALLSE